MPLFGGFFGSRVTVKRDAVVNDIVVNLPDFNGPDVPELYWPLRGLSKLIFAIPMGSTCLDLKNRIHGRTKIPLSSLTLFYMGSILISDEILSSDMFEQEPTEDSDDDVFRPRIFLGIIDEPEEEVEIDDFSSESESSSDSSIANPVHRDFLEKTQNKKVELLGDIDVIERNFDIKKNLEKIGCGRFYQALINDGFVDEGSFANITDEKLKGPPLHIPLVFRHRITALADVTKRRLESQSSSQDSPRNNAKSNHKSVATMQEDKRTVEGLEGTFTKRIDIKRAWEKKMKEELELESKQKLSEVEQEDTDGIIHSSFDSRTSRPRKELPIETLDHINAVRQNLQRDEFECLVDPNTITTSTFCCTKHREACEKAHKELKDMNLLLLEADIQVAADRIDYHNTTFVSRYQLRLIIHQFFEKFRLHISEKDVEKLLDGCVMNLEDQVRLREWARPDLRADPLFDIPLSGYSTLRFTKLVANALNSELQKKILVSEE